VTKTITAIGGLSTWACLGLIVVLLFGLGVVACAAFSRRQDPATRIVEIIRAWRGEPPVRHDAASRESEAGYVEEGAAQSAPE
jgi:hypothetical protein